jgi:hypothetical protein
MVEDLVRSIRDSAYIDLRRFCNPNSYDISMKNPVTVWVGNDSIRIRYVNVTVYEGAYKGVPHYMMPTGLANDVQTNNPWDIYKFFSGKNLPTLYIGVAKGSGSGVFEDLIRTN